MNLTRSRFRSSVVPWTNGPRRSRGPMPRCGKRETIGFPNQRDQDAETASLCTADRKLVHAPAMTRRIVRGSQERFTKQRSGLRQQIQLIIDAVAQVAYVVFENLIMVSEHRYWVSESIVT